MDASLQNRGALNWTEGPLRLASFAFFDLETTGLRPDRGAGITEIAVVGANGSLLHWRKQAAPDASLADQLPLLLDCLDGRVVVGHNLQFDFQFVAYEARRHGLDGPRLRFIDTLALARRLLGPAQDAQLETLLHRFNLMPDEPLHSALVDARATRTLFWQLVEEGSHRTLGDAGAKPLAWASP